MTIFLMWTLAVLQLKASIVGNAALKLLNHTPEKVLNRSLERIEIGDLEEGESEENNFLYKFTLSIISNFFVLIAEVAMGAYLMLENHSPISYYLAFALLYKNLVLFAIFCTFKLKNNGISFFESLNLIPKWAMNLERFSCFLSAAIFGALIWARL